MRKQRWNRGRQTGAASNNRPLSVSLWLAMCLKFCLPVTLPEACLNDDVYGTLIDFMGLQTPTPQLLAGATTYADQCRQINGFDILCTLIDQATRGRENASKYYRTSAVEYLFDNRIFGE
jgi:hypothetical protein